ncbi:hypothetical protein C8F01DRAFT_1084647 [Mycena amicta]|nr:hypothetical protein C8F01DRAFT_1084647 [Mycena amicta]
MAKQGKVSVLFSPLAFEFQALTMPPTHSSQAKAKAHRRPAPPPSAARPYRCEECPWSFHRPQDLQRHQQTHLEEEDRKYHRCPEPNCSYKDLQKSNLETHRNIHTKNREHECPECDYASTDPSSLHRHVKRKHGDDSDANRPPTKRAKRAPKGKQPVSFASNAHSPSTSASSTVPSASAYPVDINQSQPTSYHPALPTATGAFVTGQGPPGGMDLSLSGPTRSHRPRSIYPPFPAEPDWVSNLDYPWPHPPSTQLSDYSAYAFPDLGLPPASTGSWNAYPAYGFSPESDFTQRTMAHSHSEDLSNVGIGSSLYPFTFSVARPEIPGEYLGSQSRLRSGLPAQGFSFDGGSYGGDALFPALDNLTNLNF